MREERLAFVATIRARPIEAVADSETELRTRRIDSRQVILVPKRVAKLVRRVEPFLEREKNRRARIGAKELIFRCPRLIREIPRPADRENRVRHLARPNAHFPAVRLIRPLLVVDDEREHLLL